MQQASPKIPLTSIQVMPGHNPRRYFNAEKLSNLKQSLSSEGQIQPIVVRRSRTGEGYELIAGETRLRAMRDLGWTDAEANIVDVDDEKARTMALHENVHRTDLSPAEEALVAQGYVDNYQGNHSAAAASLGWSAGKLKQRLQLLHASEKVLDALMQETILLGHAELLSTLPADMQDQVLANVIANMASIALLKQQLEGFSIPLAKAKFDKSDCLNCPKNSDVQGALFSEAISASRCTGRACFTAKTAVWLEEERERQREHHPVVHLLTEKASGTAIPLVLHGESGVGRSQFEAGCSGCSHRGTILDDRIGATTGSTHGQTCFNATCHADRVAEYQSTMTPDPSADIREVGGESTPANSKSSTGNPKASTKKPVTLATTGALSDQYAETLRKAVVAEAAVDERIGLALAVYGLTRLVSADCPGVSTDALLKGLGITDHGASGAAIIAKLAQLPAQELRDCLAAGPSVFFSKDGSTTGRVNRRSLSAMLTSKAGTDLAPHAEIDTPFLQAHTVPPLKQFLEASGFKAHVEAADNGPKTYATAIGGKKSDLIAFVVNAGFDFSAVVPEGVVAQQSSWAKG